MKITTIYQSFQILIKRVCLNIFSALTLLSLLSCNEQEEFSKYNSIFLGENGATIMAIEMTTDNGFIVGGRIDSSSEKLWISKSDATGHIIWSNTYLGGTLVSIKQTIDGGYIAAGYTYDRSISHGDYDFIVLKISADGEQEWYQALGSSETERAYDIIQNSDGSYVVCGSSEATNYGRSDCRIIKLDNTGKIIWDHSYGGSDYDRANSIHHTSDGGYIVASTSSSDNNGDVTGHYGESDYWILKLDQLGQLVWQQSYGGFSYDTAEKIIALSEGGFAVMGSSSSKDAEIDNHIGGSDIWLLKLDDNGSILWNKSFGGSSFDFGKEVIQTSDGGLLVVGTHQMFGDEDLDHNGSGDFHVIKISEDGDMEWENLFGGSDWDSGMVAFELDNGSFMIGGRTDSYDGYAKGNNYSEAAMLIQIEASGMPILK